VTVAIAGVVLVSLGTRDTAEGAQNPQVNWKGVTAGLAAALTETLMYFAVRTAKETNPYFSMLELYSGALVGMLGLAAAGSFGKISALSIEGSPQSWTKMLFFNTLVGFVGYATRFFAIPQMSTVAFSLLSLVGVIASFVWGLAFVSEVPNALSLGGAALIALAAAFTDKK
jgi:drug/metabolite transporter (DMT)-like permease